MHFKKVLCTTFATILALQAIPLNEIVNAQSTTLVVHAEDIADVPADFEDYIVEAIKKFRTKIDVLDYMLKYKWDLEDVQAAYQTVIENNPQLFYVSGAVSCDASVSSKTGKYVKAVLTDLGYTASSSKLQSQVKKFDNAVKKVLSCVDSNMSDIEKALAVHDYIILNTKYDTRIFEPGFNEDDANHTAYNCLVDGVSVCQGYSLAYSYIMDNKLGVKCKMISSESMNHAWNYIKLGEYWYHVDLTMDDPLIVNSSGEQNDTLGQVSHEYFLLSESAIKSASVPHKNWDTKGLPAAENKLYDDIFWRTVKSGMFKIGNLWYYAVLDSSSPGWNYNATKKTDIVTLIKSYSFSTKKKRTVQKITSTWTMWNDKNSWYPQSYVKIATYKDKLYFNTYNKIYVYSPSTKSSKVYISPSIKKGYVYGICIRDNKLYYSIKTASDKADNIKVKTLTA